MDFRKFLGQDFSLALLHDTIPESTFQSLRVVPAYLDRW